MKSYARKQKFNLNMAKLRLQVESATASTTHRGTIVALAFSDDGKFLASLGPSAIEVWNVVKKEPSNWINAHAEGEWNSLAFSPDGKLLASGGFRESVWETDIQHSEIKLWDPGTGRLVATLSGRGPVVFSPDGKFLASASASETRWIDIDGVEGGTRQSSTIGGSSVKLWDVATREPIASFPPIGRIDELDFSFDMRLLAERSSYIVRLWDLSERIGEPQAWLMPDPAEVEFYADDPAWKTFTVHTNLDSVLVRANPSGSDPAIEVAGGREVPTRAYCPAEGNDRPTRGRRDGWSLHVKACQVGRTKILLIDYDTDASLAAI